MKNYIMLAVVVLFLVGCSSTPKVAQVDIVSAPVEKLPLDLSSPPALDLHEVEWMIVTEENIDEAWQLLKDKNEGVALFALRHGDYERLALNIKEIRALLTEYTIILKKYKEYYEGE